MNKYSVIIQPKAIDELSKIEKRMAKRITSKLIWLSEHVEALNLLHLHGNLADFYKLQVGDYRIIYKIDHTNKVITVHKIGHRRDIYK
mgnify:FL=1